MKNISQLCSKQPTNQPTRQNAIVLKNSHLQSDYNNYTRNAVKVPSLSHCIFRAESQFWIQLTFKKLNLCTHCLYYLLYQMLYVLYRITFAKHIILKPFTQNEPIIMKSWSIWTTATTCIYIIFFLFIHSFIHLSLLDVYCAHVHLLIVVSIWHKLVISFRPPPPAAVAASTSKLSIYGSGI